MFPARKLAAEPGLLPNRPGVYAIVGRSAIPVLDLQGYYATALSCHAFIGMEPVLYVGSASSQRSSVRKRVSDHLLGDARKSTFRQSLGLALAAQLNLQPTSLAGRAGFHFGEGERVLSAWMQANLSFTYHVCDDPIGVERALVKGCHPAFNIKEREWDPFARQLSARRQAVSTSCGSSTSVSEECGEPAA